MAFTERLALLLETGTPLHGALQALAAQAGTPAMHELIKTLDLQPAHIRYGAPMARLLAPIL